MAYTTEEQKRERLVWARKKRAAYTPEQVAADGKKYREQKREYEARLKEERELKEECERSSVNKA